MARPKPARVAVENRVEYRASRKCTIYACADWSAPSSSSASSPRRSPQWSHHRTSIRWPSSRAPRPCPDSPAQLADWRAQAFIADPIQQIPTRHGPIDVRRYRPASGPSRRTVTLVPGVHMDGIREARLVGMAEDLAASGFKVLTVATPDLQRFRITPTSTDIIEDAAKWLTTQQPAGGDGKIGMLGISFSGGLSIVAAGRPRAARQGRVRDVVRRARRSAARDAVPLLRATRRRCPNSATPRRSCRAPSTCRSGRRTTTASRSSCLSLAERIVAADQVAPLRKAS